MKRLGNLWGRIVSFENLLLAFRKARCGKRRRPPVAHFELNLERELLDLQRELISGEYLPGAYRLFTIYERKPRLIAAAPFRDRVVHHALLNLIEPPIDRRFIFDSYACRSGKGTHAAISRYQEWSRHYAYALKMDIARYFPSIDHQRLKEKLRHYLKDRDVLSLLDRIIDFSPASAGVEPLRYFPGDDLFTPLERCAGIPIGNLTSQFFANLYLDDFDHFLKETLHAKAYLRYVDDMVILADDKGWLSELKTQVGERLTLERLVLHPRKANISPTQKGIDFLGFQIFPYGRRLRNDNGWRFIRKLRGFAEAYRRGQLDWDDFNPSVQSWIGHASHADTLGLRKSIFSRIVFTRGGGQTCPGG